MLAATLGKNPKHNSKNKEEPRAADNIPFFLDQKVSLKDSFITNRRRQTN